MCCYCTVYQTVITTCNLPVNKVQDIISSYSVAIIIMVVDKEIYSFPKYTYQNKQPYYTWLVM